MSLEAELHELVALTFDIVGWEIGLCLTIGGGDDLRGRVHTTLKLALISASYIVGVGRVDCWVITSLTKGGVRAVRTIESVEEGVEEVGCGNLLWFIDIVIGLVQGDGLRVDERCPSTDVRCFY